MFLGDYLFAPQFLQRHAARGWSWKIPVVDIRVRCLISEYWGMYVTYMTDLLSSGDNQVNAWYDYNLVVVQVCSFFSFRIRSQVLATIASPD